MKPGSILVADDNKDLADGLAMILEDAGYKVAVEYDGTAAIEQLLNNKFDIAFIDIKMPDRSGFDVLKEYYVQKQDTLIVLMTGYRIEQVLKDIYDKGDTRVIRYGAGKEDLFEEIESDTSNTISLVLDESDNFANAIEKYYENTDRTICVAKSNQQALDAITTNSTDLLIVDFDRSLAITLGFLRAYTQNIKKLPKIAILIKTDKYGDIDPLKQFEVTGCLFKPFKPDYMLDLVEELISDPDSFKAKEGL